MSRFSYTTHKHRKRIWIEESHFLKVLRFVASSLVSLAVIPIRPIITTLWVKTSSCTYLLHYCGDPVLSRLSYQREHRCPRDCWRCRRKTWWIHLGVEGGLGQASTACHRRLRFSDAVEDEASRQGPTALLGYLMKYSGSCVELTMNLRPPGPGEDISCLTSIYCMTYCS